MGITGSITAKAYVDPILKQFTTWGDKELNELFRRSKFHLSDTFALRYHEFTFLLGREQIGYSVARPMFDKIFDKDANELVDKFEVMCVLVMLSTLTSDAKVSFIFEIFNFNEKGYLTKAETSLMVRALVTGIFKADSSIGLPSNGVFEMYISSCLSFSKEPGILLQSELIQFSRLVREAQEFMESWRGIASLVLIADNYHWRDPFFPALDASITPSIHWLKFGLPPEDFVYWIRRGNIGENGGCLALFGHTETVLKTADKKVLLGGDGLIGKGTLKQGMLADRWILNAISMIIMHPCMVKELYASTYQEDVGRFNVRIFEGGGWRSIFVDDRIPCSPMGQPLFSMSSDPYECWILILEKAIAKYLMSYGHLANCSPRPDSHLFALRWLTGGHVLKLNTEDFDWNSMDEVVVGANGVSFIEELLLEGALISLGRSETQAIPNSTSAVYTASLSIIPMPSDRPPYGRLMSVIKIITDKNGYKHIILRDPWGLEPRVDTSKLNEQAQEHGYAHTFSIKVEELVNRYDCLVICRYPDSFRKHAESQGYTPWKNEIFNAATKGPTNPARFKIVVESVNKRSKNNMEKSKGKYKADRHKEKTMAEIKKAESATKPDDYADVTVTLSSTEDWAIVGDQKWAKPQLRIHLWPDEDTVRKIREKRKAEIAAIKADTAEKLRKIKANAASNVILTADALEVSKEPEKEEEKKNDVLSLTSNVELTEEELVERAAEEAAKASPAAANIAAAMKAKEDAQLLLEAEMEAEAEEAKRKEDEANQPPPPPTEKDLGSIPRNYVPPTKKGINGRRSVFHSPIDFFYDPKNKLPSDEAIDAEEFHYKIRSARSWQSHSFKLLPGTYYIIGDVESENTEVVRYGLNLDREGEISERPWAEFRGEPPEDINFRERNGTNRVWLQISSTSNYSAKMCTEEECPGNFDNSKEMTEVRKDIIEMRKRSEQWAIELNECMKEQKDVEKVKDFRILRSKPHIEKVNRLKEAIPRLTQQIDEGDQELEVKNRIWGNLKRAWIDVKEDVWPLMAETQAEVASRELLKMINDMRIEASSIKAIINRITKQLPRKNKSLRGAVDGIMFSNIMKGVVNSPSTKSPSASYKKKRQGDAGRSKSPAK